MSTFKNEQLLTEYVQLQTDSYFSKMPAGDL